MKLFSGLFSIPGIVAVATLSMYPVNAFAWDGSQIGRISGVDVVTDASNFGFRVYIENQQPACGTGSPNWSYVNKSAPNYDALVAILTSHYLNRMPVHIYNNKVGAYCEIAYVVSRN